MKKELLLGVEEGIVVYDNEAKPGEITIRLRTLMKEEAEKRWGEKLSPLFDIFDKAGFEPYRTYYEKELEASYQSEDNYIVLAHTFSGEHYLLGSY